MSFQRLIPLGCALLLSAVLVRGQVTWQGGGVDGNFSTAANWVGNVAPANNGTANLVFGGTLSPIPMVGTTAYNINGLTYSSGVDPFNLGGSALTIQSFLNQNSGGSTQFISSALTFGSTVALSGPGGQSFLTLTGGLTAASGFTASNGIYISVNNANWNVGGTVTVQSGAILEFVGQSYTIANNISIGAGSNVNFNAFTNAQTVNGIISGAGAMNYFSPTTLNASNTYTGTSTIGSMVTLGTTNALPTTGTVHFVSGGVLKVDNNQTVGALTSPVGFGQATIASGRTLTINTTTNPIYTGTIDGAGALAKNGSGTQILTGNVTPGAGTSVLGGTLQLGNGTTGGSFTGDVAVNAGATLAFNRDVATTYAGIASGAGTISKAGFGTLTLSGANTHTGSVNVNGGTLSITHASGLGTAAGGTTVVGNATLDINGVAVGAEPVTLTGSGQAGAGALTGTGTASLAGPITLSGNSSVGGTGTLTLSGVIGQTAGGTALSKVGSGTVILAANNTYTGTTMVNAGTLRLGINGALASPANVVVSASSGNTATFDVSTFLQSVNSLTLGGQAGNSTSNVTIGSGGVLTLLGGVMFDATNQPNNATISGGTLAMGGGQTFNVGDSSLSSADLTISSVITGGTLTKIGAGTLALSGANTYTGATVINDGRLLVAANGALPAAGNITINANAPNRTATFELGNVTQTIGGLTFGGGTATSTSTNNVQLQSGAVLTLGGNVTVDAANNPMTANISGPGTLALNGTRTFTIGDSTTAFTDLNLSANISGSGFGLIKTGTGTLQLSGANTFTGSITVNEGRLQVASSNALPTGAAVILAPTISGRIATLDVTFSISPTVDALTLGGVSGSNGTVFIGSGSTLTLGGNVTYDATGNGNTASITSSGGSLLLSGVRTFNVGNSTAAQTELSISAPIGGTGGLTKTGAGTMLLSGSNTYADVTTVSGGILMVTNSTALGATGAGTVVSSGGTLTLSQVSVEGEALTLTGTGSTGQGALTNSGTGVWSGPITLAGNTTIGAQGSSFPSPTFLQLQGAIGESGGARTLTKTGFGMLMLGGVNTYTGGTVINQGTLGTTVNGALPNGGNVVINSTSGGGVVLELFSTSQVIGTLTLGGAGASSFGSSHVALGSGALTLGGTLTFDATSNPFGATIAASSPFSGNYPFGGTLSLGSATRTFNIGNSTTASSDLTIFSDITGATGAGILKTGTGTLTLAGSGNFDGGVIVDVNSGMLVVASSSNMDGSSVYGGPVGTGTLTMRSGTTLAAGGVGTSFGSFYSDRTLGNSVMLANNVTLGSSEPGSDLLLELAGTVTATDSVTTLHLGSHEVTLITGALAATNAGTVLTFDSGARPDIGFIALLGPINGAGTIASITADHAAVVFGATAVSSITSNPLAVKAVNNGYIGIAAPGSAANLLARISPTDRASFSGAFGFDTPGDFYGPNHFTENLDFTGFNANFTIGSLSGAIISGTITPPSTGYAFGNGGGALLVASNLGGNFGVRVESVATIPQNSLLAVFAGNNTYTGNLSVTNSLAILDSAYALPAASTFSLGANGYLGYTEAFTSGVTYQPVSFANFVSRLGTYTSTSVLGFDSHDFIAGNFSGSEVTAGLGGVGASGGYGYYSARYINETIDLRSLNAVTIGTATRAVIEGMIIAPNNGGNLSLIGAWGGHLEIASPLMSGNVTSVTVGTSAMALEGGAVLLSGRNTYTGGTLLQGGLLVLEGHNVFTSNGTFLAGPLGSGGLTVANGAVRATLATNNYDDTVLANNVVLNGRLQLGTFDFGGDEGPKDLLLEASYDDFGYSRLILNGIISGVGGLDVYSDVVLNGANTYAGGTNLFTGSLTLGTNTALGTGTLTLSPIGFIDDDGISLRVANGSRTIANNIVVNAFGNESIGIGGRGSLTVNGNVALNGNVSFELGQFPMTINGAVSGSGRLSVNGENALVLGGTNTYTGGTWADQGAIVFGTSGSLPALGLLTANYHGYIGTAFNYGANLQSSFINRFDRVNTSGTIGLDSPTGSPQTFTGNIDFSGFGTDARLGSATTAIFTGNITTNHDIYRFGGGGGLLEVTTALTGNRTLSVVSSWLDPLTLRLSTPVAGTNTYSDGTFVWDSALIFAASALPGGTNNFSVNYGGYIGLQLTSNVNGTSDANVLSFLGHFPSHLTQGYLGFDSAGNTVTDLDLTKFSFGGLGIATTSNLTIAGNLSLHDNVSAYRFAGYKGGQLTVASTLTDFVGGGSGTARSVEIGDYDVAATFGTPTNPTGQLSAVTLTGNNTYSGGTTLEAGVLRVGHDNALGTGALTVSPYNYSDLFRAGLFASGGSRTIANNLQVYSPLDIGGSFNLSLTGSITGDAQLYKVGSSVLTLSGNNSGFSGGIYISQGNVTFAAANSLGTGPIQLGTPSSPSVTFLVSMLVNGISGDNAVDQINLGAGTTLTVNQTFDAQYLGHINSISGGATVVYQSNLDGGARLRLGGANSYNGATTINSGIAIIAGHNEVFGPGATPANAVTLNGGKLVVENDIIISNPLTLVSGVLGGVGTLRPAATLHVGGVVDGPNTTLAPGIGAPGTLNFSNLTVGSGIVLALDNGGRYNWQLLDANMTSGSWDRVNVTGTVAIASNSAANPFTLTITPVGSLDLLSSVRNFNPNQSYSWEVLVATSGITGFSGSILAIDSSGMSGLANGGTFSFSLNTAGTSLLLNFTPAAIPEPSTYAMLGFGAMAVLYTMRRRRRA